MKQFFKFTFASVIGSLLATFILILLILAIFAASAPNITIEKNSLLELRLNYDVPELTDNVETQPFAQNSGTVIGLHDIITQIESASTDDRIAGIYVKTESASMNPTTAYQIADALRAFKLSGKPILSYGNYFTQSGYIIASQADSIFMNPNGLIDLRGYGTAIPYFKNMSEKTGIEFEVYHAGKFKSAVEPYYRSETSLENRMQSKVFLNAFHDALIEHITLQRELSQEEVGKIIAHVLSDNAQACLQLDLIDGTAYESEYEEMMAEVYGWEDFTVVNTVDYQSVINKKKKEKPSIAVVIAEGEVAGMQGEKGSINMKTYSDVFDKLEKNDDIKGVVLRVNSPGGSVWTSDNFLARVKNLQDKGKYIVASFGDYAASGGYYIAASADQIVSEPTTLTGSIGAYAMMPNFYQASRDHLGINWDTVSTGKHTFLYSSFVRKGTAERNILQAQTDMVYDQFKQVVAEGRDWAVEDVEAIAQGRVWTGSDAVEIGLVDTLGNLQDAINLAANATELSEYKVEYYPKIEKTFWENMVGSLSNNISAQIPSQSPIMKSITSEIHSTLLQIERACAAPQVRLPVHMLAH